MACLLNESIFNQLHISLPRNVFEPKQITMQEITISCDGVFTDVNSLSAEEKWLVVSH